jgi:hypothetical protein
MLPVGCRAPDEDPDPDAPADGLAMLVRALRPLLE